MYVYSSNISLKLNGREEVIPFLISSLSFEYTECHKKNLNVFANFLSHKKPILEMTTQSILLTRQFKQN